MLGYWWGLCESLRSVLGVRYIYIYVQYCMGIVVNVPYEWGALVLEYGSWVWVRGGVKVKVWNINGCEYV